MVSQVKTAISLCPSAAELLTLGTPRLVGRSSKDDYPTTIKSVEVVADIKPDYEKITTLEAGHHSLRSRGLQLGRHRQAEIPRYSPLDDRRRHDRGVREELLCTGWDKRRGRKPASC